MAGNDALRQFADNPARPARRWPTLITDVAGPLLDAEGRNLLQVLTDNDRLTALPEIAAQFEALINALSGVLGRASSTARSRCRRRRCADVVATLREAFGRKVKATVDVDPDLIGGIRVVSATR